MNKAYLDSVIKIFLQYKKTAERAMEQVGADQLFVQPNENSNSISILVKHLSGNMISRWTDFFTTDGEKPDRNRDSEFENDIRDKEILMKRWEQGWNVFLDVLTSMQPEDLARKVYIRGEEHTALEAINRQLAHYSYHVGQILYIAKMLKPTGWTSLTIPRKKA